MEVVQSKAILLLAFAAFLLVPSIQARKVNYCDKKKTYPVAVTAVDISPDPVQRGKAATFSISATTDKAISGGKMVIDVSWLGFHVHTENHDLCQETSCPITAGDFVISHSQVLPGYTPPGSYSLKMKMVGGNGDQLTCVTFDFSIGFASSVADS